MLTFLGYNIYVIVLTLYHDVNMPSLACCRRNIVWQFVFEPIFDIFLLDEIAICENVFKHIAVSNIL